METLRLQVFLSRAGVCSRRKAMDLVKAGKVSVNGQIVVEPSCPVTAQDKIVVAGKSINASDYVYLVLNKPKGYVTTRADRFAERTVLDLLPRQYKHLNPVGRLDKDTEGLLLLTNDGDLALRLTHPRFHFDKTYQVTVKGALTSEKRGALEKGIILDGKKTAPAKVAQVREAAGKSEFLLTIHEGRKRQIRLMAQAIGCPVVVLKRIAQGPIALDDLPSGKYRLLTTSEVEVLRSQFKIPFRR